VTDANITEKKPEELETDQTLKSENDAADDEEGECSTTTLAWEVGQFFQHTLAVSLLV
jgi:hypothetical protein